MFKKRSVLLALLVLSSIFLGGCNEIRTIGFFYPPSDPSFDYSRINYKGLTHIMHAFLNPMKDGTISNIATFADPNMIASAHKAKFSVKVLVAIGGTGSSPVFQAIASDPQATSRFVDAVYNFCKNNNYDGVDIDWEGALSDGSVDFSKEAALIQALRNKMPKGQWLLSMDVEGNDYWNKTLDIASLIPTVDFFNLLSYDQTGLWNKVSNYNCAVYSSNSDPNKVNDNTCESEMTYLITTRGIPAAMVNMGLPFYGDQFDCTSGPFQTLTGGCGMVQPHYNQIQQMGVGTPDQHLAWNYTYDSTALEPWASNNSGTGFITYEDLTSIPAKVDYALGNWKAGGVFIWALGQDYTPKLTEPQPLAAAMFFQAIKYDSTWMSIFRYLNYVYGS